MSPMLYSTLALAGHLYDGRSAVAAPVGQRDAGPPRGGRAARRGEYLGPAGTGTCHGAGRRDRRAFHGRPLRRVAWRTRPMPTSRTAPSRRRFRRAWAASPAIWDCRTSIMYYDSNNIQLSTKVDEVMTENVAMKYEAWGWNVHHRSTDTTSMRSAKRSRRRRDAETERPTLIIGRTVMGKGARSPPRDEFRGQGFDARPAADGRRSRFRRYGEATWAAIAENPFTIFSESAQGVRRTAAKSFVNGCARSAAREKTWRSEHKELARKLDLFLSGKVPAIDYKRTRDASADVCDARRFGCGALLLCGADREHDRRFGRPVAIRTRPTASSRRPKPSRRAIFPASSSRRACRS